MWVAEARPGVCRFSLCREAIEPDLSSDLSWCGKRVLREGFHDGAGGWFDRGPTIESDIDRPGTVSLRDATERARKRLRLYHENLRENDCANSPIFG